ncbi:MAG: hypothetical protein F6K32_03390 [Desertifilum sp. SIO1I2]|nr:hypothetical protein [Desertifilum sp. SIO1I2]
MLKGWLKSFLTLGVLLFLGFILFGDRILPQPMSQASANTRASMNAALKGLFPERKPQLKPYERTEDAIQRETGERR